MIRRILLFFLLLLLALPQALTRAAEPAPVSFTIAAFSFIRPSGWDWVIPSSAMRKVQLSIISADGEKKADVSFFTFGSGQGGSVASNVERWAKQFTSQDGSPAQAVTEPKTIHGISVTFVSTHGTYSAGMMDASASTSPTLQSDTSLRGAILESQQGDVFVKMTGPSDLVKEATPAFDAMITQACQETEPK